MKLTLINPLYRWTIALLSLLPCLSYSQHDPFKGANVILLTTDLADKEAYIAIAQILTEQSITYTAGDDMLLLRSADQPFNGHKNVVFEGELSVNTGVVKLTGIMRTRSEHTQNQDISYAVPIAYNKGKSSLQHTGFTYMNGLAQKLQRVLHGIITYKMQSGSKL